MAGARDACTGGQGVRQQSLPRGSIDGIYTVAKDHPLTDVCERPLGAWSEWVNGAVAVEECVRRLTCRCACVVWCQNNACTRPHLKCCPWLVAARVELSASIRYVTVWVALLCLRDLALQC